MSASPFLKSLIFRNDFGIVSEKGGILSYHIEKDREDFEQKRGLFFTAHKDAARHLLETVNTIQCALPEGLGFVLDHDPDVPRMVQRLEDWKGRRTY